MIKLNNEALADLAARDDVDIPAYPRDQASCGVVHFGVGGFHRAHQAMYLDTLMEQSSDAYSWGICGVGLMEGDKRMRDVLHAQNGLYTLVLKYPDGVHRARIIGSIIDYLYAPDDPQAVIDKMADDSVKIVSLTVTEGGYNFDASTGEFDFEDPSVINDLSDSAPRTIFGLICAALEIRRLAGKKPFTLVSCDNIQSNGAMARKSFLAFAQRKSPELAAWMAQEVRFPNSMVDRITPSTTDEDRQLVRERFGIEDGWPVVCEPFTQWVLEDSFSLGHPDYEAVGVQLVEDVEPYERMKLRLLNASHQSLCYLGYLCGYRYAHEICQDSLFVGFLMRYMVEEGTPTLGPVPGVDLEAYRNELIERFANPEVRDTLIRLATDGADRISKWVIPVIRDRLAQNESITLLATVVAAWARFMEASDEQGNPIPLIDRLKERLVPMAAHNQEDPLALIRIRSLFGSLAEEPRFTEPYLWALESLHRQGARATLEAVMKEKEGITKAGDIAK